MPLEEEHRDPLSRVPPLHAGSDTQVATEERGGGGGGVVEGATVVCRILHHCPRTRSSSMPPLTYAPDPPGGATPNLGDPLPLLAVNATAPGLTIYGHHPLPCRCSPLQLMRGERKGEERGSRREVTRRKRKLADGRMVGGGGGLVEEGAGQRRGTRCQSGE